MATTSLDFRCPECRSVWVGMMGAECIDVGSGRCDLYTCLAGHIGGAGVPWRCLEGSNWRRRAMLCDR